jgi:alpha-1,3/alpha-1,6-mannosyltransferase
MVLGVVCPANVYQGGYDNRVSENVSYHRELTELADSLGLKHATVKTIVTALSVPSDVQVIFFLSVPGPVKDKLLSSAKLLIYTPRNEHLGIVPLEAMLAGVPVLAANEGGPTETVVDGQSGWLRNVAEVDQWRDVMQNVLDGSVGDAALQKMGYQGRQRVRSLFSKDKMASRLEEEIQALDTGSRPQVFDLRAVVIFVVVVLGTGSAFLLRS